MYNIFSAKHRSLVKEIKTLGHKISLHFDPTAHASLEPFLVEKNAFESLFDFDIDVVSIHRPGPFLDDNDISLFGVSQTYQNKFFKQMKYISDSGGRDVLPLVNDYFDNNEGHGGFLRVNHPLKL